MSTSTADLIPAVDPEPTETGKSKKNLARWIAGIAAAAIAIGGYTYLNYSTPSISFGGGIFGPQGVMSLPDKSEPLSQLLDHAYMQTESDSWLIWDIWNDGKADVTLTQPSCKPTQCSGLPTSLPKVYFGDVVGPHGFPDFPYYDANGNLELDALSTHLLTSITIPAGEYRVIVTHFYYPKKCIASVAEISSGALLGSETISSVTMQAQSLGRSSSIEIPLPAPFIRPRGKNWGLTGCADATQNWLNSSQI